MFVCQRALEQIPLHSTAVCVCWGEGKNREVFKLKSSAEKITSAAVITVCPDTATKCTELSTGLAGVGRRPAMRPN